MLLVTRKQRASHELESLSETGSLILAQWSSLWIAPAAQASLGKAKYETPCSLDASY